MAIVTPTETAIGPGYGEGVLYTWVLTTADHTGKALGPEVLQGVDMCWHAYAGATWGSATVAAQGSNTDTEAHYGPVNDIIGGLAITFTADGQATKQQGQKPVYQRPKLTTPGTDASVTVTCTVRKTQLTRRG